LIYLRTEYRRGSSRRNRRRMIPLADMPQYFPDWFRFCHKSNNLHFAAAAWAKQGVDLENFAQQHGPKG